MKFAEIIPGLLDGKNYLYTKKDIDDVHFYVTIASPINHEGECLCIVYFEDIDEEGEIDPEPLEELQKTDLEHDLWREVQKSDYYSNENQS